MMQNMSLNFAKNLVFSNPSCFRQFQTSLFSSAALFPKPRINPVLAGSCACERNCSFPKSKLGLGRDGCCAVMVKFRNFNSAVPQEGVRGGSGVAARAGDTLPWLASADSGETGVSEKFVKKKRNGNSSWEELAKRKDKDGGVRTSGGSSWGTGAVRMERGSRSKDRYVVEGMDRYRGYDRRRSDDDSDEAAEEEREVVDDARWDKIKGKVGRVAGSRPGKEDPRVSRWNKQEDWGRKTWREATASAASPPKLVGEGVYGVGPVLAALSAGRREFYTLFVQEGLDLSSNNRKKKDKNGFENVLTLAEKIGLSVKEVSKHDLNMVVDNRPHQGLVLDASPLEMVKIFELDPVSSDDNDRRALWVALDEVMDPQNLGAIIRSAYFFGASGVVLCAKNSAPLSGVVSKASAGSLELMELRYCKNMMQFLISSTDNGWRVLGGSVSSKSVPIHEIPPGVPTILVLGSEGTGLRPLVERSCTQLVKIPGNISASAPSMEAINDETKDGPKGNVPAKEFRSFLAVESLNVSVAAGVLLHHLIGKNHSSDCDDNGNELIDQ